MTVKNNFPTIKPSLNLDFANTKQLDPRITFTRASTATYWDGKTFAKAEENLILYSQDADNAAWGKANVTIAANSDIAPDGSATADAVVEDASEAGRIIQVSYTSPGTVQQTFSVYIKPQGRTRLRFDWANADSYQVTFDLVGGGSVFSKGGNVSRAAITESAKGFYRCEMVFTPNIGLSAISIKATDYVGVNGVAFAVWGAQLEQRSQATAYTPTTDQPITKYQPVLLTAPSGVPRFDHNPVTGESLGLLIEEQRTNLLLFSTNLDWSTANAIKALNAVAAPDGSIGATLIQATAGAWANRGVYRSTTVTAGATYTTSVYAKAGTYGFLYCGGGGFNLNTGTVTKQPAGGSVSITPVGNGWYRCIATLVAASTTVWTTIYFDNGSGNGAMTANGSETLYIWGAQLEVGAFPTSYIPTTTAQVTRAADSASMTGTNFSSWYRQDEGTLFGETRRTGTAQTADEGAGVELTSGEFQKNLIQPMYDNGSYNRVAVRVFSPSGVLSFPGPTNSPNFTVGEAARKFAAAIMSGGTALASNGSVGASYSENFAPPLVTMLSIKTTSYGAQGSDFNGYIKKISYYPKRLSNTELQALTA